MLTEEKFNIIVHLIKSGMDDDAICKATSIKQSTLDAIRTCKYDYNLLKQFKAEQASHARHYQKKQQLDYEPKQMTVTMIANHYMAEEMQKQTKLLTLISNKLAYIVDELCGTKTEAK